MDNRLTSTQYRILRNIAERHGMKNSHSEVDNGADNADHYMSTILSLVLTDGAKKLNFIVKCCLQNTDKDIPSREYCLKEIFIYDIVLPYFAKVENFFEVKTSFESYVKCYGTCEDEGNECMIFDNLFRKGYEMWNRKLLMNVEHISLVMSELGKFHAVSLGMKTKFPEFFREKFSYLMEPNSEMYDRNFKNFMNCSLGVIGRAIEGNDELEKCYEKFVREFPKFLSVDLNKHEDKMVIIHGDAWCNNMMFKYQDPKNKSRPTRVCIFDWQLTQYALPVLDISYFLCTSCSKDLLYNYKKFLKVYYDSLSQNLRDMSCDPEKILSFKDLEHMFKKYSKYGLMQCGLVIKAMLVDTDDVSIIEKNSSDNLFGGLYELANKTETNRRISDVFKFFVDNGFI